MQLEPWSDGDLALLFRLNDPRMMQHLGGPETDEQIINRHRRYVAAARSETTYVFKILTGTDVAPAGAVLFWDRTWHDQADYEMGWHVLPEYQGRGIASRAVSLAIARARATRRHRFLHAFPSVNNPASNAICRRLGFGLVDVCDFEYPPGRWMRCNDWRRDLVQALAERSTDLLRRP